MTAGIPVPPETIERIRELADSGMHRGTICDAVNIARSTLRDVAARYKITFSRKPRWRPTPRLVATARPDLPPIADVDQYIAERGVTRCPPAYCAPSPQGARP